MSQLDRLRVLVLMMKNNIILTSIFGMAQYIANTLIFADLYLTLKNPFYPRENRKYKYFLIITLLMLYYSVSITMDIFEDDYALNIFELS
jgi:EamA domain-containing membrane protein RarD